MTQRIPRPNPAMLALAHDLNDIKRRIREMETASQAGFTSVEGRTLDFYDPDTDQLLGSIGLQPDGTFGFSRTGGAKPEAPTEPDVQPIPGGAIVAWDGRFEEAQSMLNIDRIAVHMDETAGFTPTRDTEATAIYSHTGGTAVIPIDDGTEWYVKLVAVSKGQVWSDPSAEVFVAAVDANIRFYQDEFTLTTAGAQDLTLTFEPIAFSEHLYWHPGGGAGIYQDEDSAWTRLGNTVSLIDDTGTQLQPGDVVTVEYAYLEDSSILVDWAATGWKYLTNAETDATDYSGPAFDDSTWSTGQAPFANGMSTSDPADWGAPHTVTGVNIGLWLRRDIGPLTSGATVSVRIDGNVAVYWNGTQIGTRTGDGPVTLDALVVPTAAISNSGSNIIAVHATDDASDPSGDYFYLDVRADGD